MVFERGKLYSREMIHQVIGGGSRQTYLPTRGGLVLAAFLKRSLNPDAPEVILPGTGPLIEGNAEVLRRQRQPIPVFLKEADGWCYAGRYRASSRRPTADELTSQKRRSGRDDVTTVVWLEAID